MDTQFIEEFRADYERLSRNPSERNFAIFSQGVLAKYKNNQANLRDAAYTIASAQAIPGMQELPNSWRIISIATQIEARPNDNADEFVEHFLGLVAKQALQ